jgi:LysR family glycine cleavage system transcriptional activator
LTERHPKLDVRILATVMRTDFAREEVDVAIRKGPGSYAELRSDLLMREDFFPVCSPELLSRGPPLREPADLAHHVLLHDEWEPRVPEQLDWTRWLAAIGITTVDAQRACDFPSRI